MIEKYLAGAAALLLLSGCLRSLDREPAQLGDGAGLRPGEYRRLLTIGDGERSYRLHVPEAYPLRMPVPVLLILHGGGGNADNAARMTGFDALADEHYFLAVYPEGSGRLDEALLTWNGGTCCGYAAQNDVDDVAFLRAVLADLAGFATLDERRIYATGMSNGGIMAYRLACEAADLVAAIAPVAGTLNYPGCSPTEPVSVIHVHGSADQHLPYQGGAGEESLAGVDFASVTDSLAIWSAADGCAPDPVETKDGQVLHAVYAGCSAGTGVELYTVLGGLHAWPGAGGPGWPGGDEPSQALDASQVIWDFLSSHPKR